MVNDLRREPALANSVEFVDTDRRIADSHGGNIFRIFLDLVNGANRQGADQFIAQQELEFLNTFQPTANCIIAAGPVLATRLEPFAEFVERTNATCIWLTISAQTAASRLLDRQNRIAQDSTVANHPNFGSWNFPHLTSFNADQQRYVLVPNEADRISATDLLLRDHFEPCYRRFALRGISHFVENDGRRQAAISAIRLAALRPQ